MELCIYSPALNSHAGQKKETLTLYFTRLTGFFDDAKSDFQQALKLNPNFEDAKVSLQQTLLDQQEKANRGY